MKYVDLTEMIDYRPYLSYLKEVKDSFPVNAKVYATKEEHWDFRSEYCPHDYWFDSIQIKGINVKEEFAVVLRFKNETYFLEFIYEDVSRYNIDLKNFVDDFTMLGSQIIIDEIRMEKDIVVHEIAMNYGSLIIECSDFKAVWIEI